MYFDEMKWDDTIQAISCLLKTWSSKSIGVKYKGNTLRYWHRQWIFICAQGSTGIGNKILKISRKDNIKLKASGKQTMNK